MATFDQDRRDALKLIGMGGVVFASGLAGCAHRPSRTGVPAGAPGQDDFYFLQLSDTHWGYAGPANPEAARTLPDTVAQINQSGARPDFIVFTGDLTHTTDDGAVRRQRLRQFRDIVAGLAVRELRFLPGEHDASLDGGAAFAEIVGPLHYAFDWKGVHFIALDNVSIPTGQLGAEQLAWLRRDLATVPEEMPVVVFAHRPLFDLYPAWDWATPDGAEAIAALATRKYVTVFYGHIHQEHHHVTGGISHHAARSLIFPLPGPGTVALKAPLPWVTASRDHGLGFRRVGPIRRGSAPALEVPFADRAAPTEQTVIRVTASMFAFSPNRIDLEVGKPATLELTTADRAHGFAVPALGLRADIRPGTITRLRLLSERPGTFPFHCDVFCGEGHEVMAGQIVVAEPGG